MCRYLLRPLVVVLLLADPARAMTDYCALTQEHTLCQHSGPGPRCGAAPPTSGLSPEERAAVVAQHNRLRAAVARGETSQPSAADMQELQWDEELAVVAQRLADQCVFRWHSVASKIKNIAFLKIFPISNNQLFNDETGRDSGPSQHCPVSMYLDCCC